MKQKGILNWGVLELAIRIWTAFYLFIYGIGKLVQFEGATQLETPLNEVSKPLMMWAFFGSTLVYPILIGSIQVMGASLLIFDKTKLIASILLTPIFLNIIVLDILYEIHVGALLNAILYQSVFIMIMIQQRKKLIQVSRILLIAQHSKLDWQYIFVKSTLAFVLAVIIFVGFQYFT